MSALFCIKQNGSWASKERCLEALWGVSLQAKVKNIRIAMHKHIQVPRMAIQLVISACTCRIACPQCEAFFDFAANYTYVNGTCTFSEKCLPYGHFKHLHVYLWVLLNPTKFWAVVLACNSMSRACSVNNFLRRWLLEFYPLSSLTVPIL